MPTPTKAFIAAFERLHTLPDISLNHAYNKFFNARSQDRTLTQEEFLSDTTNFVRQRTFITLQIQDRGPTSFREVLRALSALGRGSLPPGISALTYT